MTRRASTRREPGRFLAGCASTTFLASSDKKYQAELILTNLMARGVAVLDPPRDRDHRTLFFADPERTLPKVYAELPSECG